MNKFLIILISAVLLMFSQSQQALANFLPPDQAFKFSAQSVDKKTAELRWTIAPHYYLYHDQFKVSINQQPVKLLLPPGQPKDDPTFGLTKVHYQQLSTTLPVKPNTSYQVVWQGCAEEGLCYPVQRATISTDASGLLPQSSAHSVTKSLFGQSTDSTESISRLTQATEQPAQASQPAKIQQPNKADAAQTTPTNKPAIIKNTTAIDDTGQVVQDAQTNPASTFQNKVLQEKALQDSATIADEQTAPQVAAGDRAAGHNNNSDSTTTQPAQPDNHAAAKSSDFSSQLNNDQLFLGFLSSEHLLLNIGVFFVLGILLAFLPCSLPLIPIISGIVIRHTAGYRAALVALSFVLSMALVYSLMGIVVAEIGYSFQRWFQNPWALGIFALIFVLLGLNLFGVYQLTLPQSLVNKLGGMQDKQQGGTITGAAIMGALSALIVGPCMSAPLAGALLFVSQSQSALLGGLYLFVLGLGIGLPLFIVSVFGTRLLPKPGAWMDRIKAVVGFIMLMVAVYFIRPLLPGVVYSLIFTLLWLALAVYLLYNLRFSQKPSAKTLLLVLALASVVAGLWTGSQAVQHYRQPQTAELQTWTRVSTQAQLQQALAAARVKQHPIVIDVYADWCVACQPIEKEVLPNAEVQQALQGFSLIKLDLTQYDSSQDDILKQHEILGPPTFLFLNADVTNAHTTNVNTTEQRSLRLTGTFNARQLLQQLQQLQQAENQ